MKWNAGKKNELSRNIDCQIFLLQCSSINNFTGLFPSSSDGALIPKRIKDEFMKLEESDLLGYDPNSMIVEPDFPVYKLTTDEQNSLHMLTFTKVENVRYITKIDLQRKNMN